MPVKASCADAIERHYLTSLSDVDRRRFESAVRLLNRDLYSGPTYYAVAEGSTVDPSDVLSILDADALDAIDSVPCFDTFDFAFPFSLVCNWLERFLDDVSDLYVDEDTDEVTDREPCGYYEDCQECNGEGTTVEVDKSAHECALSDCETCEGTGREWIEPCWDSVYHYDRRDVLDVLLGKELAHYV